MQQNNSDSYTPRFSDVTDDNFNVTGSRFDGAFNKNTGEFSPADEGQVLSDYFSEPGSNAKQQAQAPVQLNKSQAEMLNQSR